MAATRSGRVIAIQTVDAGVVADSPEQAPFTSPLAWDHLDALVVAQDTMPDSYLHAFARAGKPIVMIFREPVGFECPTVVSDNRDGVHIAVAHLIEHGHRTIAFVGRDPANADDWIRYRAYREVMLANGLRPAEPVMVPWRQDEVYRGEIALQQLRARGRLPSAVMACTDLTAIALVDALSADGLVVPDDMAVIGFDNIADAARCAPPLSTVAQSFVAIGRTTGDLIFDALDGHPAASGLHCVPVTFVPRRSCGCPGTQPQPQPGPQAAARDDAIVHRAADTRRRYYMISSDLVRRRPGGPRSLAWLAQTEFRSGCFALWEGPRGGLEGARRLRIVGTYDRAGRSRTPEELCEVSAFPPAWFVDMIDDRLGDLSYLYLLPVRFGGSDWGFLALTGELDARDETAFERYNHWAVLLTMALDHEHAMRSERALLEEIRVSEERYALAAEASNDGLWDWDLSSGTVYYSSRWKALLGFAEDEIEATPGEWLDRIHVEDRPRVQRALTGHGDGPSPAMELEYRLHARDGTYRWMLTHARAIRDESGRASRLIGSMTDITDRRYLEDRLRHDAHYDILTGLPNRTLFRERLNRAIERNQQPGGAAFAVAFLDLNGFKDINDSLGHEAGDNVLVQIANRLTAQLRDGDTVARFGGDEFVLLLEGVRDPREVPAFVSRIVSALSVPLALGDHNVTVGAAAGITTSTTAQRPAEEYLRDADTAMYRAKTSGDGRPVVFDESMRTGAMTRLELESDLLQAAEYGQLELLYQPILGAAGDRPVIGLEALIRWNHPVRGCLLPGEFLPVAERTGLSRALGRWTIRQACRQIGSWLTDHPRMRRLTVGVNLSNRQFWDPELRSCVRRCLAESGVPESMLVLEVTEGVIMHNQEAAGELLHQLRGEGVRLHIDDFGTGYSSLAALHTFPIDALKIDQSFVIRMGTDPRGRELVRVIIGMGQSLGIDVIAEGVETEEVATMLTQLGCPFLQGYRFSRPTAAGEVPGLVRSGGGDS